MLREELNEKDTWDLTTIFANNEEFEKAFNNANFEIENIKKYDKIIGLIKNISLILILGSYIIISKLLLKCE